jgi:predicted  nucleic acid-binding Zn-ribbon protein
MTTSIENLQATLQQDLQRVTNELSTLREQRTVLNSRIAALVDEHRQLTSVIARMTPRTRKPKTNGQVAKELDKA